MAREVWQTWLDQPTDMELYDSVYFLKDHGFKYRDNVTVTVEHGEGIVSRVEMMLENIKASYERQKVSPFSTETTRSLTKGLINDLESVLEIQEPEN